MQRLHVLTGRHFRTAC